MSTSVRRHRISLIDMIRNYITGPEPVDFFADYKDTRPGICRCCACGGWIYAGDGQLMGDVYYLMESGEAMHRKWECVSQYMDSHYSQGGRL